MSNLSTKACTRTSGYRCWMQRRTWDGLHAVITTGLSARSFDDTVKHSKMVHSKVYNSHNFHGEHRLSK